jgi:ABC-2 type transport system permease protein
VTTNATTTTVPLRSSLASESLVMAARLLHHWRRQPMVPIQALLFPTFLLITYQFVIGKSIMRITGGDSLYGLVPTCAVAGALFGAVAAAQTIPLERERGLLSRLWALPVHRASALAGRLIAESVRTLLGAALITAVGIGLGLRFEGDLFAFILFLLVPVLVGAVFSTAVIAVAVRSTNGTTLVFLAVPAIGLTFASSGSPPLEMLPGWIQPLVEFQPLYSAIAAMRALAQGEPALSPLLVTLVWFAGLAAIAVPLAVRGYRTAAESGR